MFRKIILDGTKPNVGALDFSDLSEPVGIHGFLQKKDGKLVFEDGTEFKAFGTTVVGHGCAPEHEVAELTAKRLRSNGINMVRFHFLDGVIINYEDGSSRNFKEDVLERFDYMVYQLEKNEIYVQLDTNVGRRFQAKGDELEFPDEFPQKWPAKATNIFNRRLVELQKEYMTKLFTHVNPYTGKSYVEDRGVAIVQIMNENTLLWDFGANFDMEMIPPSYRRQLKDLWQKWLKKKYGTNENLKEAWTDMNGVSAMYDAEHLDAFVQTPQEPYYTTKIVGADHLAQQKSTDSQTRTSDYIEFLIEIEDGFIKEMVEHLRGLGIRCCINTSNRVLGPANLYTSSLYVDVNEQDAYFNHPSLGISPPCCILRKAMCDVDPRAMIGKYESHTSLITNLVDAQVDGMPLVIAEWNDINSTPYDADAYLYMISYGSLQGWSGMLNFCYGNGSTIESLHYDDLHSLFTIYNDPAKWSQLGPCSYVFRKGLVKPAENNIYICYTKDDIRANVDPNRLVPFSAMPFVSRMAGRFSEDDVFHGGEHDLLISGGLTPTGDLTDAKHAVVFSESPYKDLHHKEYGREEHLLKHTEEGAIPYYGIGKIGEKRLVVSGEEGMKMSRNAYTYGDVVNGAMHRFGMLSPDKGIIDGNTFVSDTGEMVMCPEKGTLSVETETFAGFAGKPAGKKTVANADFEISNEYMTILMLAKDGKALPESDNILLTCIGETHNEGTKFDDIWLLDMGHAPIVVDQIEGKCVIHGAKKSLKVYALSPEGERQQELEVKFEGADAIFNFDTENVTLHYELRS